MKTNKILKTLCITAILLLTRTTYAQEIQVIRTLEIELFTEHSFEESKKKLMKLIDSTQSSINMLLEEQAARGTKQLTVKLLVNNRNFEAIEKSLGNFGYVKSKQLLSEDFAYKFSIGYLRSEIDKLKLKKKKYEVEMESLDKNNINYFKFKHEIIDLEQKISENENLIELLSNDNLLINSIHIVMF